MMTFPDPDKIPTDAHMADPRPGDRFTEMYCYWVEVIGRKGDLVVWRRARENEILVTSSNEFRHKHAYGSIPGYWVRYYDSDGPYLSSQELEAMVEKHQLDLGVAAARASFDSCCL